MDTLAQHKKLGILAPTSNQDNGVLLVLTAIPNPSEGKTAILNKLYGLLFLLFSLTSIHVFCSTLGIYNSNSTDEYVVVLALLHSKLSML